MSKIFSIAGKYLKNIDIKHIKMSFVSGGEPLEVNNEFINILAEDVKKDEFYINASKLDYEKQLRESGKYSEVEIRRRLEEDILNPGNWENLKSFKDLHKKETQLQYYRRMNSHPSILALVELGNKAFGERMEKIIREIFKLGPRTSSQNDATRNGIKIEIKSARYWSGGDDCKWQHLEPAHDYDYVLFILIDFQRLKIMGIKKSLLMGELRDKGIVTYQGKQGWWTIKSKITPYLDEINTIKDLDEFIIP